MREKSHSKLLKRQANTGYLFLIPLLYGLIWFFIIPVVTSLIFSFNDVAAGETGYVLTWNTFRSYKYIFFEHPTYFETVVEAFLEMLLQAPIILVFSFFMASLLNQEFKSRTFFRVVLFLPVIVVSTAITSVDNADSLQFAMNGYGEFKSTFGGSMTSFTATFTEYMQSLGIPQDITEFITSIVDRVYAVIELSAIQILVLLTGMQSISPSLYEAAKVEGATPWESFWKITFPMVSPLILTCVVYTIVDSFTSEGNSVMGLIEDTAFSGAMDFSASAAMAWIYFVAVAIILGVFAFCVSRLVFYYDD